VTDDLSEIRDKIVEAEAYVIGAPNYYSTINAITHAFLERWFQFHHQEGDTLWGKLGVGVGVGGTSGQFPEDVIVRFFMYNFIKMCQNTPQLCCGDEWLKKYIIEISVASAMNSA